MTLLRKIIFYVGDGREMGSFTSHPFGVEGGTWQEGGKSYDGTGCEWMTILHSEVSHRCEEVKLLLRPQ